MSRAPTRASRPGSSRASASRVRGARPSAGRTWPAALSTLFAPQPGHETPLDGLRGISSVFVLVFHCAVWLPSALPDSYRALPYPVLAFWRQTWFGVDVFFVLSGFLIGRILMRRLEQGALGFRSFYIRRSFRIFPVYYLVLSASVFLFARIEPWGMLYGRQPWSETVRGSWANYLYVSNYVYGMQFPNALSWGWSLCVEEHFYLVLPAALAALFRLTRGAVRPLVLLALAAVPTLCRWSEFSHARDLSVFNWIHPRTHTHADGLVLGLLIAYTYVFHRERTRAWVARLGPATWILGVAGVAAVMRWGGLRNQGLFPVVWQFLVIAVAASLLVLNGLYLDNRFTRFLSLRVWIPLARASYCTYLIQMFVIYWTIGWWPRGQHGAIGAVVSAGGFSCVVLAVSFLVAGSTYLMLERPMLERGARLAARYLPNAGER